MSGCSRSQVFIVSPDDLWPQPQTRPDLLWQVPVQIAVRKPEDADDREGEEDEIEGDDRIGDEGIECPVGEELGVVERVAALLPCGKAREEHERRRVEEKDRLVGIGGPGKAEHGGPGDALELGPPREAVGVSRLKIAARDRTERAVEDLSRIGGCVEEQHDERAEPGRRERIEGGADAFEAEEEEIGEEELDEERRSPEDEDEPFRRLPKPDLVRRLSERHRRGEEEARQKRERPEVDVPDHPRPDQGELLAQGVALTGQKPLADADGAQGVVGNGFPAAHAPARFIASPPKVACPCVSRRMMRSSTISLARVNARLKTRRTRKYHIRQSPCG